MTQTPRMNIKDTERLQHARTEAESYGFSVSFWIRSNDPKEAAHRAKIAARWGNKALDIIDQWTAKTHILGRGDVRKVGGR
jgi:hypothetical protein